MGTSRESKQRHLGGIASEGFDVILHPFEQEDLIVQTQVQDTLFGCCGGRKKAEGANPILVSHGYLIAMRRSSPVIKTDSDKGLL